MMRWFRSLQAKYMLLILMALVLVQFTYLLIAIMMSISLNLRGEENTNLNGNIIESEWHAAAGSLQAVDTDSVRGLFAEWKAKHPTASMFWVNGDDMLVEQLDVTEELPDVWSASYTAQFIKERYDGDPFTVIAFAGGNQTEGFVVFELPRSAFDPPLVSLNEQYGLWLMTGTMTIIILFIAISFLFFRGIRKRLLQLQEAMTIRDVDRLPVQIDVKKKDEIGQLEQSFNEMIDELKESRRREQEEEQLRRELVANLSHDLRTPLTKIRAQTYSLSRESLSGEGRQAIQAMENSVVNMDRLIDNLMSYSLLMANKYKFEPKHTDIVRFVREHAATWYPVFEKEGFEIDVDLEPLNTRSWMIDPIWMGRVLDNLFQNVLRHGKSGRYIGVKMESAESYDAIVVTDRGKGMQSERSEEKGAGIGLSIVDRMVKGMQLDWEIASGPSGTTITIKKYK